MRTILSQADLQWSDEDCSENNYGFNPDRHVAMTGKELKRRAGGRKTKGKKRIKFLVMARTITSIFFR